MADDWPRYRGTSHNGKSKETSWSHDWNRDVPAVAWRSQVGTGFSSCVIGDGRLFTIGNEENADTVYCIDAKSGESIWRHTYVAATDANEFEGGPTSTPTIDGATVFTLGRHGDLFAFSVVNGEVLWHKNVAEEAELPIPAWGFAGSPLVDGNRLILNIGDSGVAVEKETGTLIWKSEARECGYSSPLPIRIHRKRSVVFGSGRAYVAVDPETGDERWRQRWLTTFGCNAADPIVFGDQLFLSSGYNRGSALLDLSNDQPSIVWKNKQLQSHLATSVLVDGYIYGASGDVATGASLICLELATGKLRWKEKSLRVGGISAAGDRLLLISDTGQLNIVRANNQRYEPLAKYQVFDAKCWTAPVLANGHVYCRSADGKLVAIKVPPP